jgi:hypothetical protein
MISCASLKGLRIFTNFKWPAKCIVNLGLLGSNTKRPILSACIVRRPILFSLSIRIKSCNLQLLKWGYTLTTKGYKGYHWTLTFFRIKNFNQWSIRKQIEYKVSFSFFLFVFKGIPISSFI